MKLFQCPQCQLLLFFENHSCERCGHALGYLPRANRMAALEQDGQGLWRGVGGDALYKPCANVQYGACNWQVEADNPEQFCLACRHNRTVPDLSDAQNLNNWTKLEFAKHRLFYTLLRLGLPLANRNDDPARGLAFDFLADPPQGDSHILTGHENGIITLALKEADDSVREKRRNQLHEPYRTLLGHFRHEIGHYYWDILVKDSPLLEECRALFGDERADYAQALKKHYSEGAPPGWQQHYVSTYATSHPWEDFAETWAHYLHIVDSLETAEQFGLQVRPVLAGSPHASAINPYAAKNVRELVDVWLPMAYALNAMNRSLGHQDLYPFVLTSAVVAKLGFIYKLANPRR